MRMTRILLVLAVVGAVALAAAATVSAQGGSTIVPVPYDPTNCRDSRFDLNGDGILNKRDITYWGEEAAPCLDPFGGALPGVQCDPALDIDQDGKVDRADHDLLYRYLFSCMFPPITRSRLP